VCATNSNIDALLKLQLHTRTHSGNISDFNVVSGDIYTLYTYHGVTYRQKLTIQELSKTVTQIVQKDTVCQLDTSFSVYVKILC
jgi:hypothetical protein